MTGAANGLVALRRSPRVVGEQAVAWVVVLACLYWWLGWGEASAWQLVLSAVVLLLMAGLAVAATWRAALMLRAGGGVANWRRRAGAALGLAAVAGLAYHLVWWVPAFDSLVAQALSALIRFGIAYFAVLAAWLVLVAEMSAGKPASSQESTAASP